MLPKAVINTTGVSGANGAQLGQQFDTVHSRHLDIGQNDIELMLAGEREGRHGGVCNSDLEIDVRQQILHHFEDGVIVVDDQDGRRPALLILTHFSPPASRETAAITPMNPLVLWTMQ